MGKRVLIIHAHPETQSFCSALLKETISFFESKGAEVRVSDLYEMSFNPVGGRHDFKSVSNPDYFKYQAEQTVAFEKQTFSSDVKNEMDKFEWCDTLIFTFPLWWFGLPAILKGWVDRTFAMGFSYGAGKGVYDNGTFKDKIAFNIITTGGPEVAYGESGKNGNLEKILFPIHHGMFYFVGMQVKPPFISFAPVRKSDQERSEELVRLHNYLDSITTIKSLY